MATERVKTLKLNTDQASTSIKELRTQLKAFKDQLAGLEEGSDEFLKVAASAGELQHQLQAVGEATRGASADFGDMLGNASKVTAGLMSGFNMANGVMTLFGSNSKAAVESIKKMQSVMGVIQGLTAFDAATKSIAKLRNTITATTGAARLLRAALTPKTLLILTAAITAITLAFEKFHTQIESAIPGLKKIREFFGGVAEESDKVTTNVEKNIKSIEDLELAAKKASMSASDYYDEKKLKNLNKESKKRVEILDEEMKEQQEIMAAAAAERDALIAQNGDLGLYDVEIDKFQTEWDEANKIFQRKRQERLSIIRDANNQEVEEEKKKVAAVRKLTEKEEIEYANQMAKAIIDPNKTKNYSVWEVPDKQTYTADREEDIEEAENSLDKFMTTYNAFLEIKNYFGNEAHLLEQQEIADMKTLDDAYNNHIINYEEMMKMKNDIHKKYEAKQSTLWHKEADAVLAFNDLTINSLNDIASVMEENSEEQKAIQIISAILSTLGGMVSALEGGNRMAAQMGLAAPVGWALGAAQATLTGAIGAVQIAKMKSASANTSVSSASSNVSSAAYGSLIAPTQVTGEVSSASIESKIGDQRVYVTEGDISSTQRKVSVSESESRF